MSTEIIHYIKRLETKIDRLERKLSVLVQDKKKQTWVKASVVSRFTGWNNEKLRQARDHGYVTFKKDGELFWYDIDSIHDAFIRQGKSNYTKA